MSKSFRGEELRTTIPGVQEFVPDVCDFVVTAARRANLNERAAYHCQMSVDEACTNIIEHGFGGANETGRIEVICQEEADRFTIRIVDNSSPFNPLLREDPNPDMQLAEREPGGWGIFFIKKMMDNITYELVDNQNTLIISKSKTPANLNEPAAAQPDHAVAVTDVGSGVFVLTPPQRLDSNTAPALHTALEEQLAAQHNKLVVAMPGVHYISTSGLKVLVNSWRSAQNNEGNIVLAGMTEQVFEVFETVGFDQVFSIYSTIDEAVAQLTEQTA
ncbi:anti-sigma factor antagonist [Chloroflexota bacterium]